MKNIKQLLEVRKTDSTSEKLGALVESGLLDENKAFQVHRALTKENTSPALLELVENLVIEALDKKNSDYLSKFDHRKKPNSLDIPAVIILKRKAIRVYPDNQKVGLYYSQQLDRYVSIPYGTGTNALGMSLNEAKSDKERPLRPITNATVADLKDPKWKAVAREHEKHDKNQMAQGLIAPRLSQRQLINLPDGVAHAKALIKSSGLSGITQAGLHTGLTINRIIHAISKRYRNPPEATQPGEQPRMRGKFTKKTDGQDSEVATIDKPKTSKRPPAMAGKAINEAIPFAIPAAIAAGRAIAPFAGRVAGRVLGRIKSGARFVRRNAVGAAAGLAAGYDPDNKPEKPEPLSKLFKNTKPKEGSGPGLAQATLSAGNRATFDTSTLDALNRGAKPYTSVPAPMRESVSNLEAIRLIAEQDNTFDLNVADKYIPMNPKVARKVVKVYEKLNKHNQIKIERMLNESATSFKKAINFVLKV